eukprot:TRINITY_DN7663_c0_g2_i7.p1 TRINITY_DN7663_c0_g2~~TRINITY_DN7663_c0_g2_i7.p1  ORF type:complete len:215 (-),score=7.72 TRINITY_DN7663_c0_g2_i7:127-771(-)
MTRCGSQRGFITLLLLYPFISRLIQCFWDYFILSKKSQLLNALKYSTAFPVAYFLMMRNLETDSNLMVKWFFLWLVSQMINTAYSYFWDVERDWDITWFSGWFVSGDYVPQIKSQKLFQGDWFYYYCLVSNLVLRFGWSYKIQEEMLSMRTLGLIMSILEVFRRFQWIFIRIETELRKISNRDGGRNLFNLEQNGHENGILRVKSHDKSGAVVS